MVKKREGLPSPDAQEIEDKGSSGAKGTYSHDMRLSSYTIYTDFLYFFLSHETKKGRITPSQWRDFFSWCGTIFSSPARAEVLLELTKVRASTPLIIRRDLGIPKATVYRVLDELLSLGLLVKARPVRTGGRPTTVYAVNDYTPEDIAEAIQRDRLIRTPSYAETQRIVQLILDDYLPTLHARGYKDIYTAEVTAIVRRSQRGFRSQDLYKPVMDRLKELGVQVVISSTRRISVPGV